MSKTATKSAPKSSSTKARTRSAGGAQARTAKRSRGGAAKSAASAATKRETRTLSSYIEERFDEFSKSQKDVARYIIDHLDEAAFQTAEELARRASTSSSTVVRFSQALGFEGYPELQQAAIEEYRRNGEGASSDQLFDFDQNEFETSLSSDHANLAETARKLSRERVDDCVEMLGSSRRVVLVGMDQMAFFASYMRHLLALLDIRAEVISSPRRESITKVGYVEEDDVVIGFSAGRAHPFLVRAMKLARHRGAGIIAISDSSLSEIGEHAEHTLYYSSDSPSYSRSNIALLALVQALVHGVYARDKGAFDDQIRAYKLK